MPKTNTLRSPMFVLGLTLTIGVLVAGIITVAVTHGRDPWIVMLGVVLSFLDVHYLRARLAQRRDPSAKPVLISVDVMTVAAAIITALLVWAQGTLWSLLFVLPIAFYAYRVRQDDAPAQPQVTPHVPALQQVTTRVPARTSQRTAAVVEYR